MIKATKIRLTALFTLGILAFSVLLLSVSYFYLHQSIVQEIRKDLWDSGLREFREILEVTAIRDFPSVDEDEVFQVLLPDGQLVTQTKNSFYFTAPVNHSLLSQANENGDSWEIITFENQRHLVIYAQIDHYLVRFAHPIHQLENYENHFLVLVLLSVPGILLLSYLTSRLLVQLAMKPITEAFRFQENFSSNVTHELLTPLTSLKGNLEVSLRKPRSAEEYRDFVALGLNETNRIILLLQDLYLLASSNFKSLDLLKSQVELSAIIEPILADLAPRLAAKSLCVEAINLNGHSLRCDGVLMGRALTNLLDNAVKYSIEGSRIFVSASQSSSQFILEIVNQSDHLEGEDTKKLFLPFYRGKNSEAMRATGKGLGLNIANYILLSHGGSLGLEVNANNGFTARVTLPQKS